MKKTVFTFFALCFLATSATIQGLTHWDDHSMDNPNPENPIGNPNSGRPIPGHYHSPGRYQYTDNYFYPMYDDCDFCNGKWIDKGLIPPIYPDENENSSGKK